MGAPFEGSKLMHPSMRPGTLLMHGPMHPCPGQEVVGAPLRATAVSELRFGKLFLRRTACRLGGETWQRTSLSLLDTSGCCCLERSLGRVESLGLSRVALPSKFAIAEGPSPVPTVSCNCLRCSRGSCHARAAL